MTSTSCLKVQGGSLPCQSLGGSELQVHFQPLILDSPVVDRHGCDQTEEEVVVARLSSLGEDLPHFAYGVRVVLDLLQRRAYLEALGAERVKLLLARTIPLHLSESALFMITMSWTEYSLLP